jgi:hypothetical protein
MAGIPRIVRDVLSFAGHIDTVSVIVGALGAIGFGIWSFFGGGTESPALAVAAILVAGVAITTGTQHAWDRVKIWRMGSVAVALSPGAGVFDTVFGIAVHKTKAPSERLSVVITHGTPSWQFGSPYLLPWIGTGSTEPRLVGQGVPESVKLFDYKLVPRTPGESAVVKMMISHHGPDSQRSGQQLSFHKKVGANQYQDHLRWKGRIAGDQSGILIEEFILELTLTVDLTSAGTIRMEAFYEDERTARRKLLFRQLYDGRMPEVYPPPGLLPAPEDAGPSMPPVSDTEAGPHPSGASGGPER